MALSLNSRKNREFIKGGFQAFRDFLADERLRFARAPILILEGHNFEQHKTPLPFTQNINHNISDTVSTPETAAGRHVHHLLAQQLGFQTILTKPTNSVPFPTQEMLCQQMDFARRVGASTVVGVGSRATLDLAKAMANTRESKRRQGSNENDNDTDNLLFEELVLVPNSYEGVLTSAHPYSLFLHEEEDIVVPQHTMIRMGRENTALPRDYSRSIALPPTTVASMEYTFYEDKDLNGRFHERFLAEAQQTALFASVSTLFDALKQQCKVFNDSRMKHAEVLLKDFTDAVTSMANANSNSKDSGGRLTTEEVQERHKATVQFVYDVSETFLAFGLSNDNIVHKKGNDHKTTRSTPLAIAVSLFPTIVAAANDKEGATTSGQDDALLKLMAACAPELGRMHGMVLPQSPSPMLADPTETVDTLLTRIQTNQSHPSWQCQDASVEDMRKVLQAFCLLPADSSKHNKTSIKELRGNRGTTR